MLFRKRKKDTLITKSYQQLLKKTIFSNISFNIPDNILSLLWFGDGPLQNYKSNIEKKQYKNIDYIIRNNSNIEPSCIFSNLEVEIVETYNLSTIDNLDYYPTYASLTPRQRFYYLKWLEDVTQKIPIGYVFIFYYGLERQLVYGNFDLAFSEILELKKHFSNHSFQSYSTDTLIIASLQKKKYEYLHKLISYITDIKIKYLIKIFLKEPLLASDLVNISKLVGFKNNYYIKKDLGHYLCILQKKIVEEYAETSMPITNYNFIKNSHLIHLAMANTSLKKRTFDIPDVFTNINFCNDIKNLLQKTNDTIKNKE